MAKLIVALDVDRLSRAEKLVGLLYPEVKIFKVGSQLFTLYGPRAVKMVRKKGADVFLDLKFYDIPNTVANAVAAAVRLRVAMLTLHIQGGREMMRRAVEARDKEKNRLGIAAPLILGITLLTSSNKRGKIERYVLSQAGRAKDADLDGVVASVAGAGAIRDEFGSGFVTVSPGVRPPGTGVDDHKSSATPRQARRAGADYIVVGRPVLEAHNPRQVVDDILNSI
ncbi:MAG: orotidine-5'-phosphate decarboxylase [Candidatus Omnitrophota bacterium]